MELPVNMFELRKGYKVDHKGRGEEGRGE